MLKKSLLSLAVTASLVGLSGCNISSTTDNAGNTPQVQQQNQQAAEARGVTPIFDPVQSQLPFGTDLIFAKASTTDGTADTARAGTRLESPVSNAIDRLDGGIGVTSTIDIPMSGSVDKDQNFLGKVFLIELANTDSGGDIPLTALDVLDILGQGTDAVPLSQPALGTDYRVDVISVNDGTDNMMRIVPLKPLKAKTKYLTVVTTGVVDADGDAIGVNQNYADIYDEDKPLVSPALGAVRDALTAWTGLANGYFAGAVDAMLLPAIPTISSITAHTTIATDSVLLGMALPTAAADTFIEGAVAKTTKEAVRAAAETAGTDGDFTGTWAAIEATYTGATTQGTITALKSGVSTGLSGLTLSMPSDKTSDFLTTAVPANVPTTSGGLGLDNPGAVYQGVITLPYYLTAATPAVDEQEATATLVAANAVQNTPWSADAAVGAVLKGALTTGMSEEEAAAVVIPPQDVDGTTQVNGNFPFAGKTSDVKVPVLINAPDLAGGAADSDCGSGEASLCPVIVYIHGITGSRGHALSVGQAASVGTASGLTENYAVVAIDLPLHGVAPLTSTGITDPSLGLSFDTGTFASLAAAAGTDFEGISERHFGYGTDAEGVLTPLVYDNDATEADEALAAAGIPTLMSNYAGAAFINPSNFLMTRDAMRQAVMDQLNLLASLGSMDFNGHVGPDFDLNKIHIVAHSLGAIIAPTVVKMVNTMRGAGLTAIMPAVNSMTLVAPGGQLVRTIENSPSFAGLAATVSPVNNSGEVDKTFGLLGKLNVGTDGAVVQGLGDYETYMNVFQATIDGVDPITYASEVTLAAQPTLVVEMVGDGGTQVIDATAINPGDITIPDSADTGSTWEGANPSPLAGTEPLITELGLGDFADTTVGLASYTTDSRVALRLKKGAHASILAADGDETADEDTVEKEIFDNTTAAQAVILGAAAGFVDKVQNATGALNINNSADVIAAP